MKFRTPINIKPFEGRIDYSENILSVGSCFADVVGGRLRDMKFQAVVNPTGVLFNPASICSILSRFARRRYVEREEMEEGRDGWFHYDFHSSLVGESREQSVESINRAIDVGHNALVASDWIIITLGTSWVYELLDSGAVVANCHKQPSRSFNRRRLSVGEVVALLEDALGGLLPSKRVILTLSPIRHVADGLDQNSLSKATLRVAIDEFRERHPKSVYYFPAYEIFMDDLRDYRFYGEDMVHPSSVGVEYAWGCFCDVALSLESRQLMSRVESIVRASRHRAQNPQSESYRRFCEKQLSEIALIEGRVNMDVEQQYFIKGVGKMQDIQKK